MRAVPAPILVLLGLVLLSVTGRAAQDLPTATYTTAHGLTHSTITRLLQDSRGFLWIGGLADLARFDGERFTTYGRSDGLDVGTAINDVSFGPDGDLWIATNGAGIYRFRLATNDRAQRLTRFPVGMDRRSNRVNTMLMARDGWVWAGTDAGLFMGPPSALTRASLPNADGTQSETTPITTLITNGSTIWVGTTQAVYRCHREPSDCRSVANRGVRQLVFDRSGRLWMVRRDSLEIWTLSSNEHADVLIGVIGTDWMARRVVAGSTGMFVVTDDRRLIWTDMRTSRVLLDSREASRLNDILEDSSGNVWLATDSGLLTIRRQGVTLFSQYPELRQPHLRSLVRSRTGRHFVLNQDNSLHRIDDYTIGSTRLILPPDVPLSLWAHSAIAIDSEGDVWVGTGTGLLRYSKPEFSSAEPVHATASQIFTMEHGLAGNHIGEIFEDSRRDLWISNVPAGAETLTVWRRESGRFERYGEDYGLPPANQLGGFVEDGRGMVWAKLREGGIVRLGRNRAAVFGPEHGLPPLVTALTFDANGALWIGGSNTVLRVREPDHAVRFEPVLTGLSGSVISLAVDSRGTLFVGTHAGLLSMNPSDRLVRRYSSFDGLPRGSVDALMTESAGTLLLIAGRTLVRLDPSAPARSSEAPRCLLTAVRIGGQPVPIQESGVNSLGRLEIRPSQNQIEIDFLGLSERFGEPLEYQYRLIGASSDWTRAAERRAVFAGLASGTYNFEVRAVGATGSSISPAASVTFRVLPPWYRSWWFIALVASAGILIAFAAHRARLAQALRTERLRARIATDLHDDIGSSLSQIAILAEVARRRAGVAEPAVAEPLASIATTSRDLVDSMSDIVWAVNPRTDSLEDLVRRMHRFAGETLGGADIALTFNTPATDGHLKLDPDLRRELYLILKESVNNIARHSGASRATVDLALERSELQLVISDDGRGFDPSARTDGNGVGSMRKRAALFGGVFTIDSAPGQGTRVTLTASLRQPKRHYASM